MVGLVGQQLRGGQYTVERKLGQGRFGVTYLASDRNDNRLVIKTLNDDLLNQLSQSEIARLQDKFWQEAQKLYGNRYVIQPQLGKGGFGITYLAKDKRDKPVVIKTLNDDVLTNPDKADYRDKYLRDFRDEV
jgi:serine/threonine protein kinase